MAQKQPVSLLAQYLRQNVSSHRCGVVVSAGKMSKAVKVRIVGQEWNKHFRKYFAAPKNYLVADPNNSLVEGDVVRIASGWRFSKQIHHVVTAIVAPFGRPVEERPPVMTEEELMKKRLADRLIKDVRSKEAGRKVSKLRIHEARVAGYRIPTLEQAMENVRLKEAEEADRLQKASGAPVKAAPGESSKDKRRAARALAEEEERKAKEAKKAAKKAAKDALRKAMNAPAE